MYLPMSWIKLNAGDKKAIEEAASSQNKNVIMFFVNTVFAIAVGIISSILYSLLEKVT